MNDDALGALTDEQIFLLLGSAVSEAITVANWEQAELTAEIVEPDNGLLYGRYSDGTDPKQWTSFQTNFDMYLAMDELRNRIVSQDQVKWSKATFTLDRLGRFDLRFTYDDE